MPGDQIRTIKVYADRLIKLAAEYGITDSELLKVFAPDPPPITAAKTTEGAYE